MADGWGVEIAGLDEWESELNTERRNWRGGSAWYVGTAVEYSVFLEYGTSRMNPKPFFRPAVTEARRNLEAFLEDNTETTLEAIDSAEQLVRTIAFALERRVKEIITEKGLVDTGTMRASVLAVPTSPDTLPTESDLPDPPEGGALPPNAGRQAVSADIEITT